MFAPFENLNSLLQNRPADKHDFNPERGRMKVDRHLFSRRRLSGSCRPRPISASIARMHRFVLRIPPQNVLRIVFGEERSSTVEIKHHHEPVQQSSPWSEAAMRFLDVPRNFEDED